MKNGGYWLGTMLVVLFVVAVALVVMPGCSVSAWDAEATDGKHHTVWNHGLEVKVDGWGFYIGPGRGSATTVDNAFTAEAEGTGNDNPGESEEPTE